MSEQLVQDQGPEEHVFENPVLCPGFSSVSTVELLDQELMSEVATQRSFSKGLWLLLGSEGEWIKANV